MEIIETQRRQGQMWGNPSLPGDPPRFSPSVATPSSPEWTCSEWQYSKNICPTLASWHNDCNMFDQVRRRTWRQRNPSINVPHPYIPALDYVGEIAHNNNVFIGHQTYYNLIDQSGIQRRVYEPLPASSQAQPTPLPPEVDDGKDDATEDEHKQCLVCMENLKVVSGKCGHLFCFSCSKRIRQSGGNCPTCRSVWQPVVRIYL